MAGRIPIIEQTTSAGSGGVNYLRAPQSADPISPALQNLARGAEQVREGFQAQEIADAHALKRQEHQDAVVWAGKTMSDAQLQWQNTLQQQKEQAAPGAPGFTPKLVDEFDAWSKKALEGAPNDTSRRFLAQHLSSLRTSLAGSALTFEAQARQDDRVSKMNQAFDSASQAVMGAPTEDNFKKTYALQRATLAELQVDPTVRRHLEDTLRDKMISGYWLGRIRQDPEAAKRELAAGLGPSALEVQAGGGTTFDRAVQFTLQAEGGLNKADTNGTPSNFGINQKANPDVDVTKLDKAGAIQLYKERYWNAIGGDQLAAKNPALALVAFDTAVLNPAKAKQMLAQSGGDPAKLMDLREQFLAGLLKSDPGKYGPYEKAWAKRNADLRAMISTPAITMSAGQGAAPSGSSVVDATPMQLRLNMIQHADTEMNRMQAVFRSQITNTENDHVAAYMNGQAVAKPLTQADYVKAYGPLEGPQRFANYQGIATLGGDINALRLATPEQAAATLTKYQPDASKPGYDQAVKRFDIMAKAVDAINTERQADPIAYAIKNKIGESKPLPFGDQAAFQAELGRRAGLADTMQRTYGTPYQVLTKAEGQTLAASFQTMTTQQKLGYLETVKKALPDPQAYRSVMQAFAPDSPVTAMAGAILAKQRPLVESRMFGADTTYRQGDVAGILLEGEALLNPSKSAKGADGKGGGYPMPKEQDLRTQFNAVVGKAFAGDAASADFAFQAVKAYYAGKGARDGDVSGDLDSGRLKAAVTAVIGGVSDVNGKGEVVRPWGMPEPEFKNKTQAAFDAAMASSGLKGTVMDNFGAYGLQSAGDGKYLLRSGTGYLTDRGGNPVVLDLNDKPSLAHLIPIEGQPAPQPLAPVSTVVPGKTAKPVTTHPSTK